MYSLKQIKWNICSILRQCFVCSLLGSSYKPSQRRQRKLAISIKWREKWTRGVCFMLSRRSWWCVSWPEEITACRMGTSIACGQSAHHTTDKCCTGNGDSHFACSTDRTTIKCTTSMGKSTLWNVHSFLTCWPSCCQLEVLLVILMASMMLHWAYQSALSGNVSI